MRTRRIRKPDEIDASKELGNISRNERQKAMLLCQVNRARRSQIQAAIQQGKKIVEASRKLCQEEGSRDTRKKVG